MFTYLRPPSFQPAALAGAGAASGLATVLGVGASRHEAAGASAGFASVQAFSASQVTAVGLAAGLATVSGVSPQNTSGAGAASGLATVSGVGAVQVAAAGAVAARSRATSMDTVLELQFEGADNSTSFVDSSPYARTLTRVGSATIRTTQFIRGGSSGNFASGSAVTAPDDTALGMATGDFTVRVRVRLTNLVGNQVIACKAANSSTLYPFQLWYNSAATTLGFRGFNSGGTLVYNLQSSTVSTNTWYDLEGSREGNTFRLFLDGVLQASTTVSGSLFTNTSAFGVGGFADGTFSVAGFLDDFQLVRGGAIHSSDFDPDW